MPALIKTLAAKHRMRMEEAEGLWKRAKKRATEEGHAGDWGYVVAIFKRMMGEGIELLTFKDFLVESQELDAQLRKLGLKRTNKLGGIGKQMGSDIYLHKDYEADLPHEELATAKSKLPPDFEYHVVKYNPKTNSFSFIVSNDFDENPEPSVDGGVTVKDGVAKRFGNNGWIYHHKWMWVGDDYKGFDVEANKQRSLKWSSLPNVDKARIGQRKFWDENVIPRIT